MSTSKSKLATLDKDLFTTFNNKAKTEAPVQTVVPIKQKGEAAELVGLYVRVPPPLKKKIKTYSVENEITQDNLITEILQTYFKDK